MRLTPPDLGIYDYFLVKWNYQPLPQVNNEWEEQAILESWGGRESRGPRYRYGRRRFIPAMIRVLLKRTWGTIQGESRGVRDKESEIYLV